MKGDLDRVHEVRDKHGEVLYRLFVRWHRNKRRVVILDGRSKPNQTALPGSDYAAIGELVDLADETSPPFAKASDFARTVLQDDENG